jgi:hypothetical protein
MITLILGWAGMACWLVCFWWMRRISSRQDSMLKELNEVAQRIEKFSQAEHEIIKQVHPAVADIKERVQDVHGAVVPNSDSADQ